GDGRRGTWSMTPKREVVLDGSWEKPGRHPLLAGIAGLLVTGALYSTIGSLVLSILVLALSAHDFSWVTGDNFVQFILSYFQRFQVPILAVTAVMEFVVFFGITYMLVSRWHSSQPLRYLSYNKPAALDVVLAGLGAIAVVPIAELLDSWSYVVFPVLRQLKNGEALLLSAHTPARAAFVIFAVSLTPAICEEAIFRGWLQRTIRRKASALVSILVTGVLFALFHMSPLSIVALAFVGFYLGYLFERSGTLFASMTAHCLYNLTIIGLVNLDLKWPWLMTADNDLAMPATVGGVVVFALVILAMEVFHRRAPA
ncbi:MAG TPA: type II CAAX endopeptidase family protein, partial [Spirochaetia bacterium]|nr:type II CAAX endopeptidase family protein [Spirochaetia bacterium]